MREKMLFSNSFITLVAERRFGAEQQTINIRTKQPEERMSSFEYFNGIVKSHVITYRIHKVTSCLSRAVEIAEHF